MEIGNQGLGTMNRDEGTCVISHTCSSILEKRTDSRSLLKVPLLPTITSLTLHCNNIPRIEGLTSAWQLRHLDLSSNCISQIEGLSSLTSLRTLNLSCNLITKVEGLNGLVNLTRLNLSYNKINNLTGLLYLHGTEYKMKHLSLHGNHLDSIDHLLQCMLGLQSLKEVTLSKDGRDNPICRSPELVETRVSSPRTQQIPELPQMMRLEKEAAALRREVDVLKAFVSQDEEEQQLHDHRKQLESRLQPGGADFHEAVAKEVAKEVASVERAHREAELQEKLAEGRRQYAALEDEFRMALTIEATRFSEVKEAYDQLTAELMKLKETLAHSQQREKKSGSLVQELTAMVKDQKNCISELMKAKRDLKGRLHSLESEVEQDRRLNPQLELLKKDKARLLSQLTAQESVIDGLRAQRRIWGQELAQEGYEGGPRGPPCPPRPPAPVECRLSFPNQRPRA